MPGGERGSPELLIPIQLPGLPPRSPSILCLALCQVLAQPVGQEQKGFVIPQNLCAWEGYWEVDHGRACLLVLPG